MNQYWLFQIVLTQGEVDYVNEHGHDSLEKQAHRINANVMEELPIEALFHYRKVAFTEAESNEEAFMQFQHHWAGENPGRVLNYTERRTSMSVGDLLFQLAPEQVVGLHKKLWKPTLYQTMNVGFKRLQSDYLHDFLSINFHNAI